MFIVIVSHFLKIFNLDDLLSSENNTRGGDKDKEEKEFIVFPYKIELYLVATTVMPVAKDESVYTTSIKNLYTNGWMLSFTFE